MISLIKNELKQLKNLALIYSGINLLNLLLMIYSYDQDFPATFLIAVVFIFALLIPKFNLNYLYHDNHFALYNALPLSKRQICLSKYLSGLLILVLPLIVYFLIIYLIEIKVATSLMIASFFTILLYYHGACLATYLTTTRITCITLQLVIYLAPMIIFLCIYLACHNFYRGLVLTGMPRIIMAILLPIYQLLRFSSWPLSNFCMIIYSIYGLLGIGLLIISIKVRKPLNNYHGFTNYHIGRIIKTIVIVVLAWSIVAIMDTSSDSISTFIALSLISSFMTVFIVQYLYLKKIEYLQNIIKATILSLLTLVIFFVGKNVVENYIPKNIQSVTINHSLGYRMENNDLDSLLFIDNQESIDLVIAIHQYLLEKDISHGEYPVGLVYVIDEDIEITRNYYVNYNDYQHIIKMFNLQLLQVWYHDYYQLVTLANQVADIEFSQMYSDSMSKIFDNKEDILLFINLLKQQLNRFEKQPELINEVKGISSNAFYVSVYDNDNLIDHVKDFQYATNDPLDLAINEFNKIKAY